MSRGSIAAWARFVLPPRAIFIHTPKCAGTYVTGRYRLQWRPRVWPVGHATIREVPLSGRPQVVGLIREPGSWYRSYHGFLVAELAAAPASRGNFPDNHPMAVFSQNGRSDLSATLQAMADPGVLERWRDDIAVIYARDLEGVFDFMLRTGTGFWTWTLMYHFSPIDLGEIRSRADVEAAAATVADRTDFIHQESVDHDVQRFLGLRAKPGSRLNISEPRGDLDRADLDLVYRLDGEVARILGGYQRPVA